MNKKRLLRRLTQGHLHNVDFGDFVNLVEGFGFRCVRKEGSHGIYVHPDVSELLNLQPREGEAKPYQIRQFLKIIEKYSLQLKE